MVVGRGRRPEGLLAAVSARAEMVRTMAPLTPKPVPTAWRTSERTSEPVVLVDLKARMGSSFDEAPRTKDRGAQVCTSFGDQHPDRPEWAGQRWLPVGT